jgi:hypothetical protein
VAPITQAPDVELASYYEAGHGAAAFASRCELGGLAVVPRPHCRFRVPSSVAPERARRHAVEIRLAGAAAEAVVLGKANLAFGDVERRCHGARTDFSLARTIWGPGADAYITWAWPRVVELVERRWAAVDALARALRCEGRFDGPRALEIVRAHWDAPTAEPRWRRW